MEKLRLLSNNLWWCDKNSPRWEEKGMDCSAPARSEGFARLYEQLRPDVIGGQEISLLMGDCLMQSLGRRGLRYAMLYGRHTPILYRPDRLELIDSEFGLYPEEIPGLAGTFNDLGTKSWALAVFRAKESGRAFLFATTHLWWKSGDPAARSYQPFSQEARVWQLGLLMDRCDLYREKYDCPAVLCGDLNAGCGAPPLRSALERGWIHGHDAATEYADDSRGYHVCSDREIGPMLAGDYTQALDHILVHSAPAGLVRRFERYTPEYYMPLSDHSPLWVDIDV